jgi:HEAT repeat protein
MRVVPVRPPLGRARVALALALGCLAASPARGASRPSFDDLLANLKSPSAKTREEAAAALGKSRRREAVSHLAALVRDPEVKVRLEVVKALRELRDPSAVPALVASVGDGDAGIRQEAIVTLVELHSDRPRAGPVGRFLQLFSDEEDRASLNPGVKVDGAVYQALTQALTHEHAGTREEAALALGILDARGSAAALLTALQDPDADVRAAAASAVGKVGTTREGGALVPLLGDESHAVRLRALRALGQLRVAEAGPALREMFEANRRREIAPRILETLSRVGDPRQADFFIGLMQDPDPERKRLAVEGLARVSDASRLVAFKKDYQREGSQEVRLAYAFALVRLGDRAFVDSLVLSLGSRGAGARCREYLVELGPSLLEELYPYLNDPDAEIRGQLCEVLGLLGEPAAIAHLEPLLADPSRSVADRANRALERLRRPPTPPGR